MSTYRVRFEGPSSVVVGVITSLAEYEGVELVSSEHPTTIAPDTVRLDVAVDGSFDDVADAVAHIRVEMPSGATIEIAQR